MNVLPPEFEMSIMHQLGDAYPAFVNSLQTAPPVSIRSHPIKRKTFHGNEPVPWTSHGEYLSERPVFTLDPLFHGGSYYVQEASSMFLEQAFLQSGLSGKALKVLDLCAAPGGKSTHILSLLNRESLLISNETIRSRASILSENIQKWGYPNAVVTNNDPADFRKLPGFFDVIVIDAPCSGEGLFRKDPNAMREWSLENVQLCSARQKRIVSDVWDSLRENGILVYCTCTYNKLENEANLQWLKENHAVEFLRIETDPLWGVEEVDEGGVTGYHFYPHRTKGEGFFLSVIRKREPSHHPKSRTGKNISSPARKITDRLDQWLLPKGENIFFQFNDLIFYTPFALGREMEFLLQNLKVMYAGTNLATLKHDKLVPEHALALSVEINKINIPVIEVNEADALKYLRKENLHVADAAMGFSLLTYQQTPVGWANVLANRINNMYPAEWRIRMGG